jgi:hypothetical protein
MPSPATRHRAVPLRRFSACLAAALVVGASVAQGSPPPLAGLVPATAVLVLHVGPGGGDLSRFGDLLEEHEREALTGLLERLGAAFDDEFGVGLDPNGGGVFTALIAELADECPAVSDVWAPGDEAGLAGEGVLAVSMSPFNPVPGFVAAHRPNDVPFATAVQDALVACFDGGLGLVQDDVPLWVLGDGGDMPLVVARIDGTFLAGSEPELVRAAVRLARGSSEPSHLGTAVGRAAADLHDGGLGVTVDLAALAETLAALRGTMPTDPELEPFLDRALATMRSVGGAAARIKLEPDALLVDAIVVTDPGGGDPRLAAMIACSDCRAGPPALMPAGAVAVSANSVPLLDLVAWIDGWLADAGALIGEPLDLRSVVAMATGLDLDGALLDWIGTGWHSAQLAPLGTDVRGWIVGPGTVAVVEVRSEAAAQGGVRAWRAAADELGPALAALLDDVTGPGAVTAAPEGASGWLAVRELEYRGVPYERWRIGPTTDLGIAVLSGHLAVAWPASALQAVIDVHLGADAIGVDPVLGPALAAIDAAAAGYAVVDVARHLRAAAALADLAAAPLASAIAAVTSIDFPAAGSPFDDDFGFGFGFEPGALTEPHWDPTALGPDPLGDLFPIELEVPGTFVGTIMEDIVLPSGIRGTPLELVGLVAGEVVEVEMVDPSGSYVIDTYLYVIDLDAGTVLFVNDDAPDVTRSEVVFEVQPGVRYGVIATSWSRSDVGAFRLTASVQGASPVAEETDAPLDVALPPVTFDEALTVTDLLPLVLERLADRVGVATSVTVIDGAVRRDSWRLPLR